MNLSLDKLDVSLKGTLIVFYVFAAIFIVLIILNYCMVAHPEKTKSFFNKIKKPFQAESKVETVYDDKTKNYSGTEFLPIPSKSTTADSEYVFLGWNKFARNKHNEFETRPIFLRRVKTFVVNVYDEKDNLLERFNVEYGAGIKIKTKLVNKQPTKEFEFKFVGWDKDTTAFYDNCEIHPLFKASPIKYNYKFVLDDGKTVVLEKNSIYGTPIICPPDPLKVDDNYLYEFVGWKDYKRDMILTKNCVFVAMFNKIKIDSEEAESKRNDALTVVVNDYKNRSGEAKNQTKSSKQETEKYKTITNMKVEINPAKKVSNQPKKEKDDKNEENILKGVIVKKNTKKK